MSQNQKQALPKANLNPTIILVGGGSGGHITPLLSVARAIKDQNAESKVVYIGLNGENVDGLKFKYKVFNSTYTIPSGKFRRYHGKSLIKQFLDIKTIWLNFRDIFKVLGGFFKARKILKELKPNIIFLKGSFVSLPVGLAARSLSLPFVTHDSDAVEGLANKLVAPWAKLNLTGQPTKYYSYQHARFVGVPIDPEITFIGSSLQQTYKKELGINNDDPVLLISGSSLGAQRINEAVISIAAAILDKYKNLTIYHICGQNNFELVEQAYNKEIPDKDIRKRIKLYGFTESYYKFSGAADLIVARAGATSIAEFAVQGKPCIIIPSKYLAGGHQLKNAASLKDKEAAVVMYEPLNPTELLDNIYKLLDDPKSRLLISENIAKLAKPDAALDISKVLLDIATTS